MNALFSRFVVIDLQQCLFSNTLKASIGTGSRNSLSVLIENYTIQLKSIYYKTNICGKNVPYVGIVIIVDVGLIRFAQWFSNKRLFQTTMIKIKG